MSKADSDIVTIIPAEGIESTQRLGELWAWLNEQCPEAMQIPFNRQFMRAVLQDVTQGKKLETKYWVGFDDPKEAMHFKLTWS